MRFSDQLRKAICTCGLSRYRIAQEAGIDQASLSRFLGGAGLTTKTLDALADVLRLRVEMRGPRAAVLRKERR
jgi:DNA transposition AAA+ family ATPase